jgi:hypothetical protein
MSSKKRQGLDVMHDGARRTLALGGHDAVHASGHDEGRDAVHALAHDEEHA